MKFFLTLFTLLTALSAQNPPVHPAWNGDKVHEIRLRFKQADYWAQLTANYAGPEGDTPYLEASFEWGQYKFDSVGVRFKGNSSYRGASTKKKPFRIKLNEFVKGQKIEGIGAYNLSNGWNDPSLVREPAYYELASALGLVAPRTNYAALYVNDEYIGLYLLGEVINDDFLKNHLGKGEDKGNLYKANIGATFAYLGEDKAAYKEVWEKQTNEDADDWADLIALCKIIGDTPAAELKAKLEPLMDIDSFLTAIALDNATVNLDSYVGMGQNFNVYRRPSDNKWVWLVWDPSLAFGAFSGGGGGQAAVELATEYVQAGIGGAGGFLGGNPGGNPGGGFPGGGVPPGGGMPPGGQIPGGQTPGGNAGANAGRPLATKLWEIPEYKERYRQIYKNLATNVFQSGKTIARMNALRAMIRPYVEADTQKLSTMAQFDAAMTATAAAGTGGGQTGAAPGGGAPGLQPFVEGRLAWLKTQFDAQTYASAALTASVNLMNFTATATTQKVDLTYTGVNTPPSWSLQARTQSGAWLTTSVAGGPLPGSFTVTAATAGLANGVHAGAITVYLSGAPAITIPVTLTVGSLPVPAITGIANAASYSTGAISPGQLVTVFGTNMGPAALSTDGSGTRVTFDGTSAQVLYSSAGQLGVIAPLSLAGKSQTAIQVSYGNQSGTAVNKAVAPTAPGLFSLNAAGSGPGAIVNQAGTINSASAPAPKGSIVAIYLTGGGVANATGILSAATTVTIGGQAATVAYAGNAPGAVQGLYQVNATIPANAASGPVPVVVTIGGVASQTGVTVNVQ